MTFTRHALLNKALIYIGYLGAGFLIFRNIHYSAIAIRQQALIDGMAVSVGWLDSYTPAIMTSLFCFLWVGLLSNPAGLPLVINQLKSLQKRMGDSILAMTASSTIIAILSIGLGLALYQAYRFDIYTTAAYLGALGKPWNSMQFFPVGIYVFGPEAIVIGCNSLSQVLSLTPSNGSSKAPIGGSKDAWDYMKAGK